MQFFPETISHWTLAFGENLGPYHYLWSRSTKCHLGSFFKYFQVTGLRYCLSCEGWSFEMNLPLFHSFCQCRQVSLGLGVQSWENFSNTLGTSSKTQICFAVNAAQCEAQCDCWRDLVLLSRRKLQSLGWLPKMREVYFPTQNVGLSPQIAPSRSLCRLWKAGLASLCIIHLIWRLISSWASTYFFRY